MPSVGIIATAAAAVVGAHTDHTIGSTDRGRRVAVRSASWFRCTRQSKDHVGQSTADGGGDVELGDTCAYVRSEAVDRDRCSRDFHADSCVVHAWMSRAECGVAASAGP